MHFLERLVVPPGGPLLLMALGWWLMRRRPRAGRLALATGFLSLLAASLPWVGAVCIRSLESVPAWEPRAGDADVIVVLGAGVEGLTPEYGGLTPGPLSLQRVRWAAHLARLTDLPLAVTGGSSRPGARPVATLMADVLQDEYDLPVRWTETSSGTTWENAARCAELLLPEGIRRVALVTHAWHMPRALLSFERHGFEVVPAPTMFHGSPPEGLDAWLPTARALRQTSWAAHEWLGALLYRMRSP